jgi:hypothetical protein
VAGMSSLRGFLAVFLVAGSARAQWQILPSGRDADRRCINRRPVGKANHRGHRGKEGTQRAAWLADEKQIPFGNDNKKSETDSEEALKLPDAEKAPRRVPFGAET